MGRSRSEAWAQLLPDPARCRGGGGGGRPDSDRSGGDGISHLQRAHRLPDQARGRRQSHIARLDQKNTATMKKGPTRGPLVTSWARCQPRSLGSKPLLRLPEVCGVALPTSPTGDWYVVI